MSLENWKLEKDLCRCCHSEGSFKNLAEPFKFTDVAEIYADILKECYDIDMAPAPGMLSAATYTICEVCIMRLRDASEFKKQVLSCEERFKDLYYKNVMKATVTSVEVEIKQEIPDSEPDNELKEELPQDDNDDEDYDDSMDLKISEEDEKPLRVAVRKKRKYKTRTSAKSAAVKTKKKTKRKPLKQESADTENDAERKQDRVVAPRRYLKMKKGEEYEKVGDTFHCARCEKTYGTLTKLGYHWRLKHRSPKYKCSICIEAFSTLPPLIVHKLEVHNVDDRFKCSSCNSSFNAKRPLSEHMKHFHMLGEKHKCEICDFETFSSCSIRRHIMFTHKTEKDLHCRFCKKSFKRKNTLNFHERIHTGDRRKVCTVCGQAFVQKASLNYHMTKYHPEVNF